MKSGLAKSEFTTSRVHDFAPSFDDDERFAEFDRLRILDHDGLYHAGARCLDLGVGKIQRRAIAQRLLFADRCILIGRPVRLAAGLVAIGV